MRHPQALDPLLADDLPVATALAAAACGNPGSAQGGEGGLPEAALQQIAEHFRVLAEPTRLALLRHLRDGERNVGELAALLNTSAANASRQLQMLAQHGLIERENRGPAVFYRVADPSVFALCELVCGQITRRLDREQQRRSAFTRPL